MGACLPVHIFQSIQIRNSVFSMLSYSMNLTPQSSSGPLESNTWPSGQSEDSAKWFPISKNLGLETQIKFLACSETELLHKVLLDLLLPLQPPGAVICVLVVIETKPKKTTRMYPEGAATTTRNVHKRS